MDYKICKYLNGKILENIVKCWTILLYKNQGQNTFYLFVYLFSLRVYLVLAESKIEKQFSSQIFKKRVFKKVSINVRISISFQMFVNPCFNVSVGFTYITGVAASTSTEKLINYIGL